MPSRIEKEYIDNLQSFTDTLGDLVELLQKQHKKGEDALNQMSGAIDGNKLKTIAEDIKALVKSTDKIENRTKEILAEVKEARKVKEGGIFQSVGSKENKHKVVDGVKLILLISAGVLAMGMAFKLVGNVDPMTVISLSFGMVTMAYTFQKLSEIKELTAKKAILIGGIIVLMSTAIMLSSQILRWTAPIDLITAASVLFVGSTMGVAAIFLLKAFSKIDITKPKMMKSLLAMPIILPLIATSIVLSSYILSKTHSITLKQGLTALAVGGILGIATYLLLKSIKGQDLTNKSTIASIMMLPILLPLVATSIALSSVILAQTKSLTFKQGFSALVVGTILGAATFLLLNAIKGQNLTKKNTVKNIMMLPFLLPLISAAIVLSSYFLSMFKPIKNPGEVLLSTLVITTMMIPAFAMIYGINKFNITPKDIASAALGIFLVSTSLVLSSLVLQAFIPIKDPQGLLLSSLAISAVMIPFGLAVFAISKLNLTPKQVVMGAASIVLISAAILASSWILSKGDYSKEIPLDWAEGVGLSLVAFGAVAIGLGSLGLAALIGIVMIPLVAGAIILSSKILAKGDYKGGPSLDWAKSTGLIIPIFGLTMIALGALGLIGGGALLLGMGFITLVSRAIVDSSHILAKGNYKGGPTKEWSEGTGASILAFAEAFTKSRNAGKSVIQNLFGGGTTSTEDFLNFIITISNGIKRASELLNSGKFYGGPTKEWSEGTGGSIAAFAEALATVSEAGHWWEKTMTGEEFSNFITTVAMGMQQAAITLGTKNISWVGGPTKEWSEGVGIAINSFANALTTAYGTKSVLSEFFGGGSSATDIFVNFIRAVANGILIAGSILNNAKFNTTVTKEWAEGVGGAISVFTLSLKDADTVNVNGNELVDYVSGVALSIRNASLLLSAGKYAIYPTLDWVKSLKNCTDVISYISNSVDDNKINALNNFADAIKTLSYSFSALDMSGISKLTDLSASISILSVVDTTKLNNVITSLDANKLALNSVINSIAASNAQTTAQTTGIFDTFKNIFDKFNPEPTLNEKISTTETKIGDKPLKIDDNRIVDELKLIRKQVKVISEMMIGIQQSKDISGYDTL